MESESPVFAGIGPADLTAILEGLEERTVSPGAVIIAQGSAPHALSIIHSGQAEVYLTDRDGTEHHLTYLGPGATVGEMSLFTGQPASASVRAVTALTTRVLPEQGFHRVASRFPSIYLNLGAILSQRLSRANRRVAGLASDTIIHLQDRGAHPLTGYALACSLAWHLKAPVLYLVPPDTVPAPLQPYIGGDATELLNRSGAAPRAHAVLSTDMTPATLEALSEAFLCVLVGMQTRDSAPPGARTVILTGEPGSGERVLTICSPAPTTTLRARATTKRVHVPDLESVTGALAVGLLDPTSGPGEALGWAARDLTRMKVGLALGAGSAKGYAHVGVLQVLTRAGVPVDYVAGTSVGSCVAAAHALGFGPQEIATTLDTVGGSIWRPTVPTSSLLSSTRMRAGLQRILGDRTFADLAVPLAVVAADMDTQQAVVFEEGLVWPALLASTAIPGIFPPQRIGPHTLVDGGVLDPVPQEAVAALGADRVIAVKLASEARSSPSTRGQGLEPSPGGGSVFGTIMRSIEIMQTQISARADTVADAAIEVVFSNVDQPSIRNFSQGRRFIPLGTQATEASLPTISSFLPWVRPTAASPGFPD